MIDDPLTPEERMLAEQLQAMPKPELDGAARAAIRQRMLDEFRAAGGTAPLRPVRRSFALRRALAWAAALLVVALAGLFAAQRGGQNPGPPVGTAAASPATQVAAIPSPTGVPAGAGTATAAPPTLAQTAAAPSVTPAVLPPAPDTLASAPAPENSITIEGPVTSIAGGMLTVYGFQVELPPQHPMLQIIDVGDMVRVQGALSSSGVVAASAVSNIPGAEAGAADGATVGLDGPVEAVEGRLLTVNGIPVQLDEDDPLLKTVQVGDFVSVQGNFETSGTEIVLAVVNIAVIDNAAAEGAPLCWYHDTGMGMGHWHCDGMGMGMGMGMGGDGMGMGMGN